MKLKFKTNAFDLDVKDMAAEMGITKQFLYKIYDNKMNVSEKRAKEMLNILKDLDAKAEKNEEELVKKRRNERKQMIKQMEKIVSKYSSDIVV